MKVKKELKLLLNSVITDTRNGIYFTDKELDDQIEAFLVKIYEDGYLILKDQFYKK